MDFVQNVRRTDDCSEFGYRVGLFIIIYYLFILFYFSFPFETENAWLNFMEIITHEMHKGYLIEILLANGENNNNQCDVLVNIDNQMLVLAF
jgi:hypothetical protein